MGQAEQQAARRRILGKCAQSVKSAQYAYEECAKSRDKVFRGRVLSYWKHALSSATKEEERIRAWIRAEEGADGTR